MRTDHQTAHRSLTPVSLFHVAYAGFAYLAFLASFGVYWIAFLADRWVPVTVDARPGTAFEPWIAAVVDLGLVVLFGLQHSVMARPGFKRRWTKLVPPHLERSTYVLLASGALSLLMGLWQPIPSVIWEVRWAPLRSLLQGLFVLGLPLSVVASFQIDHFELFGLRQVWRRIRRIEANRPSFVTPWLYRLVRHPIQLGVLLLLWATPRMTAGHLLLAAAMTAYVLIGLAYEERDLVAELGDRYRDYRRRVPKLLPGTNLLGGRRRRIGAVVAGGLIGIVSLVGLSSAGGYGSTAVPGATPELERHTVRVGDLERSFELYRPDGSDRPRAVVVVLHGSGGGPDRIRALTGHAFERLADEFGFLVVYPEGFEGNWNGCRREAPFSANHLDVDDVGFVRALVTRLRERHGAAATVDAGRVHLFGFSGGGHLALRLAFEAPDVVGRIAVVGANLPTEDSSDCAPARTLSRPVLLVAGTEDPINPYEGGRVVLPASLGGHTLGRVRSARETAHELASLAGHPKRPLVTIDPEVDGDPGTRVERRLWRAPDRPTVLLLSIVGGGHTIPQAGVAFPEVVGRQTDEVDAAAESWRFFASTDDDEIDFPPPATFTER